MRTASIIDYPRDQLDKTIWDTSSDDLRLQPEIQDQIVDITHSFLDDMDLPESALIDVFVYGSILTNQYNSKTDVDARVLLDAGVVGEEYPGITGDDIYELVKQTIHGVKLGDTNHPFNATVVIEGDKTELGQAELGITKKDPVYSLKEETLVQFGDWYTKDFDPDKEFKKERDEVSDIMDKLDKLIQETRSDTIDFVMIEEAIHDVSDPDTLRKKLDDKLKEVEEDAKKLVDEYDKLKQDRTDSYKKAPKDDRHKAPGNVRYKMLEKYKYVDLLKQVKKVVEDGLDPTEMDSIEDLVEASYSLQYGPNYDDPAPPSTITGPAAPTERNPLSYENGGMMHGAACPRCGYDNPTTAKQEGNEIECKSCGKKFSPDSSFSMGNVPQTDMESRPYESDFALYSNAPVTDEEIDVAMKDLGISQDVADKFKQKIKDPNSVPNSGQQQNNTDNQQTNPAEQPQNTTQDTMKPMKQLGQEFDMDEFLERSRIWDEQQTAFIEQAEVGHEYKQVGSDNYCAILPEMSDPTYAYRVQWYNSSYPIGHSSFNTVEDAAKEVFRELGPEVERADGSMDKFVMSDSWAEEIKRYVDMSRSGARVAHSPNKTIALIRRACAIMHYQKEYVMNPKRAWFDEPSQKEPGGSPYPDSQSLAEAGKEKNKEDKKKEKKKERKRDPETHDDGQVMEVVTVLEGIDVVPFIEDDELLKDLLKEFPIMGEPCPKLDKLLSAYMKTALPGEPPAGTGQYIAPMTPDYAESPVDKEDEEKDLEFVTDIGEEIGIKWSSVEFSPKDLYDGIVVELEHGTSDPDTDVTGDDIVETAKIAWAHLKELPDYYQRLEQMEKKIVAGAYMTLCPQCKSIQKADFEKNTPCSICKYPIPSYRSTHPEEAEKQKEVNK